MPYQKFVLAEAGPGRYHRYEKLHSKSKPPVMIALRIASARSCASSAPCPGSISPGPPRRCAAKPSGLDCSANLRSWWRTRFRRLRPTTLTADGRISRSERRFGSEGKLGLSLRAAVARVRHREAQREPADAKERHPGASGGRPGGENAEGHSGASGIFIVGLLGAWVGRRVASGRVVRRHHRAGPFCAIDCAIFLSAFWRAASITLLEKARMRRLRVRHVGEYGE